MSVGRDLSGFRDLPRRAVDIAPPTAPAPRISETGSGVTGEGSTTRRSRRRAGGSGAPTPASEKRGTVGRDPRRKVMVALAADLHRRLRSEAERRGVFKADVVLDGYRLHAETLRGEHKASKPGIALRTRRRRAVEDATQCQLYLTDTERDQIDSLAAEIGLSRSDLVSRLVELELSDTGRV